MNGLVKITIISLVFLVVIFSIYSVMTEKYLLADSLNNCCEGLFCNDKYCSDSSTMRHKWYYNCNQEKTLTCKDCIDAWRYWRLCNQTEVKYTYCIEYGVRYSSWCGYENPLNIGINGPGYIASGVVGHFAASTTGGCPDYYPNQYKWLILYPCNPYEKNQNDNLIIDALPCDEWNVVGSNSPNLSHSDNRSYYLKCISWNNYDTTYNNPAVSNILYVEVISD